MSGCPKWVHCHGAGGGGGGGAIALVVVLCVAAAAVLRAVWSALIAVGDTIALALEIVALVVISALGAAALGALGYGAFAVRRRVLAARRRTAAEQLAPGARWAVRAEVLEGGAAGVPTPSAPAIQGKQPRTVPANVTRLPVGDWSDRA